MTAQRKERLRRLAVHYWIDTEKRDHYDSASAEDLAEYLYGGTHIDQWVAVTYHGGDSSHYYLKTFPTRKQAEEHAIEYVTDDLFTEVPISVVDLDDPVEPYGKVYRLKKLIPIFEGS